MRLQIDVALDYEVDGQAEILLQIAVADMADQRVEHEEVRALCVEPLISHPGEDAIGRRIWATGAGEFRVEYHAIVDVTRDGVDIATLPATPLRALPTEIVPYLMPSRYCESEQLEGFVKSEFPSLTGGALAAALSGWVHANLTYQSGTSTGTTTALATFKERTGVCRDYAHLLVALARAGDIPARCASAYAPGVDPPDFHAVAELWLGGAWHLVDATGMASCGDLARVVVGRDATDIAFMTVFGTATMKAQNVSVIILDDATGGTASPVVRSNGVTTEEGLVMDTSIDEKALDSLSVTPPDPEDGKGHIHDPRQDAGQDKSIAERLERDPENREARLDAGLDESMDASDPPSSTQPVHNTEAPASSGYDAEHEAKRKSED